MTRQTTAPIARLTTQNSIRTAREIVRLFNDDREHSGDLSPAYQRGTVWTTDQRIALIRSWLQGLPVPAVIINDRTNPTWPTDVDGMPLGGHNDAVIDGKQRIETAIAWFGGDLAVPASWFAAEDVETTVDTDDGPYVTYSGLTLQARRQCANRFQFPIVETTLASIQEEAEVYLLVNGTGTAQTSEDLANAARVASGA